VTEEILPVEVIFLTPKEVLYVSDALSHAQFLAKQCREAAKQLQDPALRQQAQNLADQHSKLYDQFYNLI
jgi:hypothetical protein